MKMHTSFNHKIQEEYNQKNPELNSGSCTQGGT